MSVHDLIRALHIACGGVALLSFWTTAALPKGTRLHRRIGGIYLYAMAVIMVTALPLAAFAFFAGHVAQGAFLAYLVIITATALATGWRAVRDRRSISQYLGIWYRPTACLNILAGVVLVALGLRLDVPLFYGMALIGIVVGSQMLRFAADPPSDRTWWLRRHYIGIVASGAATHISFLNIGLKHLMPESLAVSVYYFAWFGPVIASVLSILWLNRRYGRAKTMASGSPVHAALEKT